MKDKILIRQTYVAIVLSELYAQVASLHSYIWLTYVRVVRSGCFTTILCL